MPQSWRNRTLNDLRRGRIKILVATDAAARGIDVPTITHVVNFDLPKQAEDYVHRIGRTGRAGRNGTAITLAESGIPQGAPHRAIPEAPDHRRRDRRHGTHPSSAERPASQ